MEEREEKEGVRRDGEKLGDRNREVSEEERKRCEGRRRKRQT